MKKKWFSILISALFITNMLPDVVFAENLPEVIINEIAWSGSVTTGDDEWIELYNRTGKTVSLSGYQLEDDGDIIYTFESETIGANEYFMILKNEESLSILADLIISSLSLANAGDTLKLIDPNGVADIVNSTGGAWFAGSSKRESMSRIDSEVSGDLASNWQTSLSSSSIVDSGGEYIIGTPNELNIISAEGSGTKSSVYIENSEDILYKGDEFETDIFYNGDSGLFSYGLLIEFPSDVLQFKGALSGIFLSDDGDVETSFQSGFYNNSDNILSVSEARLDDETTVSSGNEGVLAVLKFEVIADSANSKNITFLNDSFLTNLNSDINIQFQDYIFNISDETNYKLTALQQLSSNRYEIVLSWDISGQADSYIIYRGASSERMVNMAEVTSKEYIDDNSIVPNLNYYYKIEAFLSGQKVAEVELNAMESRGLKGDFNHDDQIDGRDLTLIAKHWNEDSSNEAFDSNIDINLDDKIDSLDLFLMSINWGQVYKIL